MQTPSPKSPLGPLNEYTVVVEREKIEFRIGNDTYVVTIEKRKGFSRIFGKYKIAVYKNGKKTRLGGLLNIVSFSAGEIRDLAIYLMGGGSLPWYIKRAIF